MKKIYYFSVLLLFALSTIFAQEIIEECASDDLTTDYFNDNPIAKEGYDEFNLELAKLAETGELSKSVNSRQRVHEIPIVVHILSKGDRIGTVNNLSDQQVIDWIDYTNKVFEGTANGFLNNTNGGAVIPIKLVLAKINPRGRTTNGIDRIDLSRDQAYVRHGISAEPNYDGLNGLEMARRYGWENIRYYNIYVAHRVASRNNPISGYASQPTGDQRRDKTVMWATYSGAGQTTLAHEIGHALGLRHTHQAYVRGEGNLVNNSIQVTKGAVCPPNNNCRTDGDMVCDTPPVISLVDPTVNTYRCLTGGTNQCTGFRYGGVEQNVMSYTYCSQNRFTPGQSDRAIAHLLKYRRNLINSPVLNARRSRKKLSINSAKCTPKESTKKLNQIIGTVHVSFNEINNWTTPYNTEEDNFYTDFTKDYFLDYTSTTILSDSPTKLSIKTADTKAQQKLKVYIDYNNDGVFSETDELVLIQKNIPQNTVTSVNVTPPAHAVLNTPLRMRIITDFTEVEDHTACENPEYGDVEDYAVTIVSEKRLINDVDLNEVKIVASNSSIQVKANDDISSVMITDISGKLVYKEDNVDKKDFSKVMGTKNQVYVVFVSLKNGTKHSQKIIL